MRFASVQLGFLEDAEVSKDNFGRNNTGNDADCLRRKKTGWNRWLSESESHLSVILGELL
jgi:hypothetical protein